MLVLIRFDLQCHIWFACPPDWVPGFSASLVLSGFCNPELAEASWLMEDNRGHLLSVCFLWCPATKLCCQNRTPKGTHVHRSASGDPAHWSTFIAYWLHWGMLVFCQSPDTIAAMFEKVFTVGGSLHNHAINLKWSGLVEHRKTFSTLRQQCCSPGLHKNQTDLELS